MDALRRFLLPLPPGPVSELEELQALIAACWPAFDRNHTGGMKAEKLYDRLESVSWEPPLFMFTIERHGGTVCGSTRAETQHWKVDVNQGTATFAPGGHRQLYPAQPKLNIQPLVDEIARLVLQRKGDSRLKWHSDGHVRVLIGNILPETRSAKQTREGRRRRFSQALETILASAGWKRRAANTYEPPQL